jgi:hypothetical protein
VPHPSLELRTGLEDILQRILDGQIDLVQVGQRLDELLTKVPISITPHLQELAQDFCAGLVRRLLWDSMAFRVAMIAEMACRVAKWSGGAGSTSLTALCAHRLMLLDEWGTALALLGGVLEGMPKNGATEDRLAEVLRAKGTPKNYFTLRGEMV